LEDIKFEHSKKQVTFLEYVLSLHNIIK